MRSVLDRAGSPTAEVPEAYLADPDCGPALQVYLALRDEADGLDLTPLDRFYNRYYWFSRFANAAQEKFGFDAGLQQQNDEILEMAEVEFDWAVIEELTQAASE